MLVPDQSLIAKITSYGWTLNENRISPYEFVRYSGNNVFRLKFVKDEWRMIKNGIESMFVGQDAKPEDILSVLSDLNIAIL